MVAALVVLVGLLVLAATVQAPPYRPVSFSDGTHRVGADVAPGTYTATVSGLCEWTVAPAASSSEASSRAAGTGVVTVTVADGDTLTTRGCGAFRRLA